MQRLASHDDRGCTSARPENTGQSNDHVKTNMISICTWIQDDYIKLDNNVFHFHIPKINVFLKNHQTKRSPSPIRSKRMAPIKAYPKLVHLVTSPDPEEMPVTSCDFNCFPCHIFGDWNLGGICCFGGVRRCLESKRKSIINLALTVVFFQTALPHVHSGMSAGTMPPDSCCAQMLKMLQ